MLNIELPCFQQLYSSTYTPKKAIYSYTNVYGIIHNSQKVETTQISIDEMLKVLTTIENSSAIKRNEILILLQCG
jgi:hypothetical protein